MAISRPFHPEYRRSLRSTDGFWNTRVAQTGVFQLDPKAKIQAKISRRCPRRTTAPTKLLKTKDRRLAERVGLVPVVPAPVNNLGRFQSLKSLETLKS